jgi:hypothetical protein
VKYELPYHTLPYTHAEARDDRIERHPRLSANELRRAGIIDSNVRSMWGISPGSTVEFQISIDFDREPSRITVNAPRLQQQEIAVEWTECNFGGSRPWLACPACGERRGHVYLVRETWKCRTCHSLKYESQRLRPNDRSALKAGRIRSQLSRTAVAISEPLPEKPRGMRWTTYIAKLEAIIKAEQVWLDSIPTDLPKVEPRRSSFTARGMRPRKRSAYRERMFRATREHYKHSRHASK